VIIRSLNAVFQSSPLVHPSGGVGWKHRSTLYKVDHNESLHLLWL